MQVEAAEPGRRQHLAGENLAEGDDHRGIEAERPEGGDLGGLLHRDGRADREVVCFGKRMDRRRLQRLPTPSRPRWAAVDRRDLVPGLYQRREAGDGELRSSEKRKAHGGGLAVEGCAGKRVTLKEVRMKAIPVLLAVGLLGLGACDRIENDPDIQEAKTAIKGAIADDGAALKKVRDEAQAAREADPEAQNTDESQEGR